MVGIDSGIKHKPHDIKPTAPDGHDENGSLPGDDSPGIRSPGEQRADNACQAGTRRERDRRVSVLVSLVDRKPSRNLSEGCTFVLFVNRVFKRLTESVDRAWSVRALTIARHAKPHHGDKKHERG